MDPKAAAIVACLTIWRLLSPLGGTAQDLLIRNGRIIDGSGRVIASGSVVVRDGLIASVSEASVDAGALDVIDAAGLTVMPGLIDAHVHLLSYSFARSQEQLDEWMESTLPGRLSGFLESGVTTVLDNGDFYPAILDVRSRLDRGELRGPRLLVAGPIFEAPDGHPAMTVCQGDRFCRGMIALEVTSPVEARRQVQALAAAGVDVIKATYHQPGLPSLQDSVLMEIAHEAERQGLPLLVHEPSFAQAVHAVELGADRLVHVPWSDEVDIAIARDQLLARGIPVATTIGGAPSPLRPPNTEALSDGGVTLAFGTDAPPFRGYDRVLATEVQALADVLSDEELVAAMTRDAAAYLGLSQALGTLEPGKRADIVILDGDPLSDLSSLSLVRIVLQGGRIVVDNR